LAEAGIFINPGKLEDYALALEKRVDQKIIANQVKNYSWEKIIAQYEDLLTQI
jgi:glycosyltransferase involved in cell wall biosynthesis